MTLTRNFSMAALGGKRESAPANSALVYGGVVLGILAGAAVSTYVWRARVHEALDASPGERADKIIESCEKKLERIERLMQEFGEKK